MNHSDVIMAIVAHECILVLIYFLIAFFITQTHPVYAMHWLLQCNNVSNFKFESVD